MEMVEFLFSESDKAQVRELLSSYNLNYDDDYDTLLGVHDVNGRLVATGARSGYILKMIAVACDCQSTDLYSEILTALVDDGYKAGHESFFVFTKPEFYSAFTALNFHMLSITSKVVLLEYGRGIKSYLNRHKSKVRSGENGAVIVNCNPFTRGHQYLIECASEQCEHLYVFVVEEDSSTFPYSVRMRLVQQGTEHLSNVTVLPTGNYAVSRGTFPSYFISQDVDIITHQIETDLNIFAKHIAPFFNIKTRFAGTEPYCSITGRYNEGMEEILPANGISFEEIQRAELNEDDFISASKVRKLISEEKIEEAGRYLPEITYKYIQSEEFTKDVSIKIMAGRH